MKKQFLEPQPDGTIHLGRPSGIIAGKTPAIHPEDISFITATYTSPLQTQILAAGGRSNNITWQPHLIVHTLQGHLFTHRYPKKPAELQVLATRLANLSSTLPKVQITAAVGAYFRELAPYSVVVNWPEVPEEVDPNIAPSQEMADLNNLIERSKGAMDSKELEKLTTFRDRATTSARALFSTYQSGYVPRKDFNKKQLPSRIIGYITTAVILAILISYLLSR